MREGSLTIAGTGYRMAGQVTREAESAIRGAAKLFFLVSDVVTAEWLTKLNSTAESLQDSYATGRDRNVTYAEMTERILTPVREGKWVCAAFYGHPGVFASTSHDAIRIARAEGHRARMLPGISAEDCLFADLGLDPGSRGCQSFEATDFLLRQRRFDPSSLLILWQVGAIGVRDYRAEKLWSRQGLEILAARLLESYAPEHEVVLYEASPYPVCEPMMLRIPLSALASAPATVRTTLCVPPVEERASDPAMLAALGLTPTT